MSKGWSTFIYAETWVVDNIALCQPLYHIWWIKPFPKSFVDSGTHLHNLPCGEVLTNKWCPCLNDGWHRKTSPTLSKDIPSQTPGPQPQARCCNENESRCRCASRPASRYQLLLHDLDVESQSWPQLSMSPTPPTPTPSPKSPAGAIASSVVCLICVRPAATWLLRPLSPPHDFRNCCQLAPWPQPSCAGDSRLNSYPEKYSFLCPPGIPVLFKLINSWEDVFQNKQ